MNDKDLNELRIALNEIEYWAAEVKDALSKRKEDLIKEDGYYLKSKCKGFIQLYERIAPEYEEKEG